MFGRINDTKGYKNCSTKHQGIKGHQNFQNFLLIRPVYTLLSTDVNVHPKFTPNFKVSIRGTKSSKQISREKKNNVRNELNWNQCIGELDIVPHFEHYKKIYAMLSSCHIRGKNYAICLFLNASAQFWFWIIDRTTSSHRTKESWETGAQTHCVCWKQVLNVLAKQGNIWKKDSQACERFSIWNN